MMSVRGVEMNKLATQTAVTATEQLVNLWLHGKSVRTSEYYRLYELRFFAFV